MNGAVTFALRSQIFRLEASREDDELFIMFRDQTAGHGTYASGRYLSAPLRRNNDVELDFNLAYNPPCAFTDYATCAFAPKENHLKLRIEAGETFSGH
jgi:hypothetical protein